MPECSRTSTFPVTVYSFADSAVHPSRTRVLSMVASDDMISAFSFRSSLRAATSVSEYQSRTGPPLPLRLRGLGLCTTVSKASQKLCHNGCIVPLIKPRLATLKLPEFSEEPPRPSDSPTTVG